MAAGLGAGEGQGKKEVTRSFYLPFLRAKFPQLPSQKTARPLVGTQFLLP